MQGDHHFLGQPDDRFHSSDRRTIMDGSRAKRRRHNRRRYQQLEDDTDSLRSSIIRRRVQEPRSILCDKCWLAHTRRRATKRCVTCKQNLCSYCAKIDESRRRTWWPSLLINCWRFLFLKAFRRHTIVDLEQGTSAPDNTENERSRSPSTHESPGSSYSGRHDRLQSDEESNTGNTPDLNLDKPPEVTRQNAQKYEHRRYYCPNAQALYRAYSFDKNLNKRKSNDTRAQNLRRTRSAERLPNKDLIVDRESKFRDLYHKNWEQEPFDFHRAHIMKSANVKEENKNDSQDNKNARSTEQQNGDENNEKRFKRGKTSRRGIKHVADIFPENASVKRDPTFMSSEKTFRQDEQTSEQPDFKTSNKNSRYNDHQNSPPVPPKQTEQESKPNTAYIVEEPPDSCPVCLESIPSRQARRLSCLHTIHTCCLIDLLNKMEFDFGVKCPICNQITQIRNYYIARHLWYKELPVVTS